MAHILALPGCVVSAPTREQALDRLPDQIRDHCAWLQRHNERVPSVSASIEIEIAEECTGIGPFDPGDAAALFGPDRDPVSPDEVESTLRLLSHSRRDLLSLVQHLPQEILDGSYGRGPPSLTVGQILRHVGNAEEWYVSRLVPPETLPPEWNSDEELDLFEFLSMERRTAMARLRQLTAKERSSVRHPAQWTEHPEEEWTLRKALRRALEHELQHTAQVRRTLDACRRYLLSRLAAERAVLLHQLLYLDRKDLERAVDGEWTVWDIVADIAGWDRWMDRTMRAMAGGGVPDLSPLQNRSATNGTFLVQERGWTREQALTELLSARSDWVSWLKDLPLETFFATRTHSGSDWTFSSQPLQMQWRHDAHHARSIADWRDTLPPSGRSGDKAILLAALVTAREELLAAAALVPVDARTSWPVCGTWTLKDTLGHIADWEEIGVAGLRQMADGQDPYVERIADVDAWNAAHAEARRDQPWTQVWTDLHDTRRALTDILESISQAELDHEFAFPWGAKGTPTEWTLVLVQHEHTHARGLRKDSPSEE